VLAVYATNAEVRRPAYEAQGT